MRRLLSTGLLFAAAAACATGGCGGSGSSATTAAPATAVPAPSVSPPCRAAKAPAAARRTAPRPSGGVSRGARLVATVETSCGTIRIALDARDQPRTVASFVHLARLGFYDGLTFSRIARASSGAPFAIQGGDPLRNGKGGPGYHVVERPRSGTRYVRGTVAMVRTYTGLNRANIGPPGDSGSAFFIVTARELRVPAEYAVLGHVVGGEATVRRIAALPARTLTTEAPLRTVLIRRVRVAGG